MPEASPLAERLKEMDRPTLLLVQSEVSKLLIKATPKGIYARYRMPAVGNTPAMTYDLVRVRCGRENCRKCVDGGHGPYWYRYWNEDGKRKSKYIGLHLPKDVAATGTTGDYRPTIPDEPIDAVVEAEPRKPVGRRVFRRKQ